ncbi:hypothetical protein BH10PLA1_BH10PLA1_10480 [soil metagenome]
MVRADPSAIEVLHPSSTQMRMKMLSHPATLAPMRKEFEAFTQRAGFSEADRGQIILVVNEALANVMRHAYNGATDRPIELTAEDTGDAIRINMRDWGNGKIPPPHHQHDPETPGGLGMVCLKQFMSQVSYHPEQDGMTLTMVRNKREKP